jgi:hypothetical protein
MSKKLKGKAKQKARASRKHSTRTVNHTTRYPQLGEVWTEQMITSAGGEMAGAIVSMLKEGGIWPWPNARATFTKVGENMVVTSTI